MNPLALQDVDNEMLRDADEYLRKHKILELFEVRTQLSYNSCIGPHYSTCIQAARQRRSLPSRISKKQKR